MYSSIYDELKGSPNIRRVNFSKITYCVVFIIYYASCDGTVIHTYHSFCPNSSSAGGLARDECTCRREGQDWEPLISREGFMNRDVKTKQPPAVCYYNQPETPLPEICSMLLQLGGGSVDLVRDDTTGIATLCLNQPEKRNAITGKMMVDLLEAVESLEGWSVGKGVLLFGKGGNFCSGGDLNVVRIIANPDDGFKMATFMHHVLHRLYMLPLVTVALVEGSGALGGGAEIAVSCDYRLLTSQAGIGFVHGRMGIVPAWGGGMRLVKLTGPHRALDLLLTAKVVKAPEALDIGLADGVVGEQNAVEEALNWLKDKTSFDVGVVRAAKKIVSSASVTSAEKMLEEERRIFAPLWGGSANKEALSRFFKSE